MDNSIMIGQNIWNYLSSDQELVTLLGSTSKILPLMSNDDNITYPFVVYSRSGLQPKYDKDGISYNNVQVTVICVSDDYKTSCLIANRVRHLLEFCRGTYNNITVSQSLLTSCDEWSDYDAYVQRLVFDMQIE